MKKKTTKKSTAKFELSGKTAVKVIEKGKVRAEIILCSDGLYIKTPNTYTIKWQPRIER